MIILITGAPYTGKTALAQKLLEKLIVEGCYIPFDWQKDFTSEYLENIKYYCLIMSEDYIRRHFADIKRYADCRPIFRNM